MASSSIPSPPPSRNWVELPPEMTALILQRVGAFDMLLSARRVCKPWHRMCSDPDMWRVMDLSYIYDLSDIDLKNLARKAVEMSCGQLIDLSIHYFADDHLLHYISNRSSQLRRLRLVSCFSITDEGLSEMVKKLPLLEELHLHHINVSKQAIEVAGRCCPHLKSFQLNNQRYGRPDIGCDADALAIAENMPGLRHLQLFGNKITSNGLLAILNYCPYLESLDTRQCLNLADLEPDLLRRLSQQMKDLKLTYDSHEDYEFDDDDEIDDLDSFDNGDPSGLSDIDIVCDDSDHYDDDSDHDDDSGGSYVDPYEFFFDDI